MFIGCVENQAQDFNPHLPCGRRHFTLNRKEYSTLFQSTPSVWKATQHCWWGCVFCTEFQSTPSVWKATHHYSVYKVYADISIHAFRVEGDRNNNLKNIDSPISIHAFRVEGDDIIIGMCRFIECISIHAFRVEGDMLRQHQTQRARDFNPRLPCGRRPTANIVTQTMKYFNPRLPCGRRHPIFDEDYKIPLEFQSTPSVWKATTF